MICTVGLNCMDIVSFVKKYPIEDSDQRYTIQFDCFFQILWMRIDFFGK